MVKTKKIFLIVIAQLLVGSCVEAMAEDYVGAPVPMQIDEVGSDRKQAKRGYFDLTVAVQNQAKNQEYEVFKNLINAILYGQDKSVAAILDQKKWKFDDFYRMKMVYEENLKTDFNKQCGDLLDGQWPFTPIWLALEMVILVKKNRGPTNYQQQVSILATLLAREKGECWERLKLRKNRPPCSWYWMCWCCCVPCICFCCDVYGDPVHCAAQADNTDALEVFFKKYNDKRIFEVLDNALWPPFNYAVVYGSAQVLAYLKLKGIDKSFSCVEGQTCCCEDPRCLVYLTDNKTVKKLVTDAPDYKPMCCDGCC